MLPIRPELRQRAAEPQKWGSCYLWGVLPVSKLPTFVYIYGFNLYYGAVKNTPYRWLNVAALCQHLLPSDQHDLRGIRYYTAQVKARPHDPDQPLRQQIYWRALQTIPILEIHRGHFLSNPKKAPLADGSGFAEVLIESEKGSDVNLASHLIRDGFRGAYDCAVVISNDTDLLEPIRIVKDELGKKVGIICPHPRPSDKLRKAGHFFKTIRPAVLQASQFPTDLTDATGTFHKPPRW